jgi:hypothetical protein
VRFALGKSQDPFSWRLAGAPGYPKPDRQGDTLGRLVDPHFPGPRRATLRPRQAESLNHIIEVS